jgi:putative transposase
MRQSRLALAEFPHHVTLRGNNRRRLFSYASDYRRFLCDLMRAQRASSCAVNAIALMTNHVHLIVRPPDDRALSRFVQSFAQRYAQLRNQRRQASGRLFEERFWSRPILNEQQLAITTAYIELNPVRAGMVDTPAAARWTSYALHAGHSESTDIPPELWTPSEWYLSLGRDSSERATAYVAWCAESHARGARPEEVDRVAVLEAASAAYSQRLLRPDGTSAREPQLFYVCS